MTNPLDLIMDTQEAAELWNLDPDYVKRLCQQGKLQARKLHHDWIIVKDQPNPRKRKPKAPRERG